MEFRASALGPGWLPWPLAWLQALPDSDEKPPPAKIRIGATSTPPISRPTTATTPTMTPRLSDGLAGGRPIKTDPPMRARCR